MPIFDIVGDILGGKAKAPTSVFPGARDLGEAFQEFLLKRLQTPVEETQQFRSGRAGLRDATSEIAATSRARLGQQGVEGGFLDSGNLQLSGNIDIDRGELRAFGRGVRDLILGLEDRREQGILPFLGGAQEAEIAHAAAINAIRGQNLDLFTTLTGQGTSPGGASLIAALLES